MSEPSKAVDTPADIVALADRAARARRRTTSARRPDSDAAHRVARDGFGPVVARYIEARTGEFEQLSAASLAMLEQATNDWLRVYARHYGVECAPGVTVRTAAVALLDTYDAIAAARVLTGVPAADADETTVTTDGENRRPLR